MYGKSGPCGVRYHDTHTRRILAWCRPGCSRVLYRGADLYWHPGGARMTLIRPDDQILDYLAYQKREAIAQREADRFIGFYEKWRSA